MKNKLTSNIPKFCITRDNEWWTTEDRFADPNQLAMHEHILECRTLGQATTIRDQHTGATVSPEPGWESNHWAVWLASGSNT